MKNKIILLAFILSLSANNSIKTSESINLHVVQNDDNVLRDKENTQTKKTPQERTADSNEKIADAVQRDYIKTGESVSNIGRNCSEIGRSIGVFVNWMGSSEERNERKDRARRNRQIMRVETELNECFKQNIHGELDEKNKLPIACSKIVNDFLLLAGNHEFNEKIKAFKNLS
jgi:hypothetical protein